MITIQIERDTQNKIQSFSLTGHAGYGESGNDIVCSAVSAVTNMVIIGINEILKANLECEKAKSGFLSCKLTDNIKNECCVQTLLESMVEEFRDIEHSYEKNIKVIETKK